MLKRRLAEFCKLALGLVWMAVCASACAAQTAQASGLRIAGAYDLTPLAQAAQQPFQAASGVDYSIQPSTSSLEDLRAGKADVAILGREPSAAELQGLRDSVVAYDAVCLLISARTYHGGLFQTDNTAGGGLIVPSAKFAGIQNLTLDEVKNFEANLLLVNHDESFWVMNNPPYLTFQGYYDPNTNAPEADPDRPNQMMGMWIWNPVAFEGENLPRGKFDTQAVLLDKFGYSDTLLNNPHISFATRYFDSEEELISARFTVQQSQQMAELVSSYPFEFFVRQASRRVTVRAIEHKFLLKALSIDGIDPVNDPGAIYSGSYPLSRKIHVLTRQAPTADAQKFVDFLLNVQGQELVKAADFLPLPHQP